jgi:hypothetical protein
MFTLGLARLAIRPARRAAMMTGMAGPVKSSAAGIHFYSKGSI